MAAVAVTLAVVPAAALAEPSASVARERAARILSERRFHDGSAPMPLRGVFTAIGNGVEAVTDPIGDLIDRVSGDVPGGTPVVLLVLAALVVTLAVVFTSRTVRRRGAAIERLRGESIAHAGGQDPDALEREAEDAERTGSLDRAVRLRFRAGLLRLDRARAIEFRPSLTTTEVSGALTSPLFDDLALTFEEVAYGGREAAPRDVDTARANWPTLLAEVGGR